MTSKSTTGAILTVCGALSAAMILAILLVSGHQTANAATGVTDPVTGHVNTMAIDMDSTGNTPGTGTTGSTVTLLGTINTSLTNVPLNSTVVIDVIVDEIAQPDGNATGYGFDLSYNPAIVSIDGHNASTGSVAMGDPPMVTGGFEPGVVNDPDTSGDWRVDYVTLGNGAHYGEGVLTHVGIHCGDVSGSSALTLTNGVVFTKTNTNGDPTAPIIPGSLGNATISCGEGGATTAPATTAPATTAPATTAPATTAPATTAPATTAPATTAPATTAPATTAVHTATATPTPTPTPHATAGGATTAHGSGSPTPKVLPPTGGSSGDSNSMTTVLLMLALGAALIVAAGGSVVYARAGRKE